ncbi:MAG: HlyD family efflux transporter periplasmic adaptor subunit [Eubacteriales bacterium]|nr:HlyD family efflux transporter periplasmic adaptor subunit [Eubacteriales bacterium]MDD3350166.1 HlyD family efflux transporter periplasmic adaptor subunit [Eubacteriales bacterium]
MQKNEKKKLKKPLLLVFFLLLAILFTVIYILPTVTGALTQTSFVEYGSIEITDDISCYIVRDEEVYYAKNSGEIQYYFDEGAFLRKGSNVLSVSSSGSYQATENTLLTYYHDGLEDVFKPEDMTSLDHEKIKDLEIEVKDTKRKEAVKGEPLYKLIDNRLWYVVFWVDEEDIMKYQKDGTVYLKLPEAQIKGTTKEICENGEEWFVVLEFDRYYKDLAKLRALDTSVITSKYEGLIIANENITAKDGKPGVYVKDINGDYIFTPVLVITSDGEYSLVESTSYYEEVNGENVKVSTVDAYDEILNHPERK